MEYALLILPAALVWVLLGGKARLRTRLRRIISPHLPTLTRRRLQLVHRDAYGGWVTGPWEREIRYFLSTYVEPKLSDRQRERFRRWKLDQWLMDFIDLSASQEAEAAPPIDAELEGDPIAYERYCLEALARSGWQADSTRTTGDQGADVVARKGRTLLVVQCKLYSRPVGNKAVQEVMGARAYYGADLALVVSNAAFTNGARALAQSSGVMLMHHDELPNLDLLIESRPKLAPLVNSAPSRRSARG